MEVEIAWLEVTVRMAIDQRSDVAGVIAAVGDVLSETSERPWMMATEYLGEAPPALNGLMSDASGEKVRFSRERHLPPRPG